jgi:hypothetical protein
MEKEILDSIYETTRSMFLDSELLLNRIEEIKNKRLNKKLKEMIITSQTDLLNLLDLIYEMENSTIEIDLQIELSENGSDFIMD